MNPRIGTPQQFATLRQFLQDSNYTEPAICDRLDIPSLSKVVHLRTGGPEGDALEWLIRLFLLEETLPAVWIPPQILDVLRALGLATGETEITGTVKLYPVRSVYVISDRDLSGRTGADHVFSAISPQTEEFLQLMPETRCPACLEVCAGAGAAALLSAQKSAVQAFAFDVSERCRAFAEFSRHLNGIRNLTVKRGDMYAPAGGQTFDRILAHPPYVPALRNTQLFRDGGEDGEWLTRRVVEGLPNYLHFGGRLYLVAMLAEYPGQAIADRVRGWLRDSGRGFDMIVVLRRTCDAGTFFFDNCAPDDLPRWRQFLDQRRIRQFRYTNIIIERHREAAAPVTVVREAGDGFAIGHAEAALALAPRIGDRDWLRALRPKALAGIKCTVESRLGDGGWVSGQRRLSRRSPFHVSVLVAEWVPEFLAKCDGTRSVAELGHEDEVRELVAAGILEVA